MPSTGTLWTTPYQIKGKIIRSVASLGDVEISLPEVYEHYVDNKKPEFTAKFPHGKIPAWEGANGFKLFEGIAIARYIAGLAPNSTLNGSSPQEAALVDQWTHLVDTELDPHGEIIRGMCKGVVPYQKAAHTSHLERQLRTLLTLEAHIASHTFFVGERITIADLVVATSVAKGVSQTIDAETRKRIPNLMRHLETVYNHPKIQDILGPIEYTEKGLQYTPPAKAAKVAVPGA